MIFFSVGIEHVILISAFSIVNSNDIFINPWQLKAPNQPYEDHNATVGDTITFFWSSDENHTVYINPTGNCNNTENILVGRDSPASYTFSEIDANNSADGQPVFFADNIAQLCEWGMRFVVDVSFDDENDTAIVSSLLPTGYDENTTSPSSYPTQTLTNSMKMSPTKFPTIKPTAIPSDLPSKPLTLSPTFSPSISPSVSLSISPSGMPSQKLTMKTAVPTNAVTKMPTSKPTMIPSSKPSDKPTLKPTSKSTNSTLSPTEVLTTVAPTFTSTKPPTPPPTPGATPEPSIALSTTMIPTIMPAAFPSDLPSKPLTTSPTFSPSASPSVQSPGPSSKPSKAPFLRPLTVTTLVPTATQTIGVGNGLPSDNPTEYTIAPEEPPKVEGEKMSHTLTALQMGMAGITDLSPSAVISWEEMTAQFSTSFVFNDLKDSVFNFVTTYEVTDISPITLQRHQRMMRGNQREMQSEQQGIIVEYTQIVQYDTIDADKYSPIFLVTAPFETDAERAAYVTLLGTSSDDMLTQVTGVSDIQIQNAISTIPPESPSKDSTNEDTFWTKTVIIGIACGGSALLILIVIFLIYCCRRKHNEGGSIGKSINEPPALHVSVNDDEVSTLAGPHGGPPTYGDQSVATMDYDYSKAYGGAGDTSVSSAGGTFGSNTQNISLPTNALATGAALGALDADDNASYDAPYNESGSKSKDEVLHIFAPPGKLGVVIDTPDDGAPVVHAVKESSVIADRIIVGDKLVAVDDEDVRSMTAIKVSKMISRKGANPSRKLTIIRTKVVE